MHWIAAAAARAGIPGADTVNIPRGTPLAPAWESAARALGLTQRELATRLAATLRTRVADPNRAEPQARRLLPEKLARRYGVFPLRQDDREIVLATADPTDLEVEQAVTFAAGRRAVFELAPPNEIQQALNAAYSPERAVDAILSTVDAEVADTVRVVEEMAPEEVAHDEVEAAPVVKLTNLILRDAVTSGASDVHVEPGPRGGSVRFRIDGVMRQHMQLPMSALNRVVSRIKVLGRMDIADRMRPQDGRTRVQVDGRTFDLRISTVPTRESEKAVIRVLRTDSTPKLDEIGIAAPELRRLRQLLTYRDGIVVVTGPTGSGKTTSLYAAIKDITTGDTNVMTVEDPVEYELPGITQIQVDARRGVTFASALRAILRQDPDVIFVGEIRDLETAQVAVQAAMTGHLVLATLHTNDAMSSVARLADLGLDRPTISASLRGALAQRLVRRVCAHCAVQVGNDLTADEQRLAAAFSTRPVVRAVGCPQCANTGYRGRVPIDEVAIVTPQIAEQIGDGAAAAALQRAAIAGGMRSLRDVALEQARAGVTTLQEIERVLGDAGDGGSEEAEVDAGPPAVLLVEDDIVERQLARALLDNIGLRVVEALDGREALDRLGMGEEYALVITDLHMPRTDGRALLRQLRSAPATAGLPVIVLTGSDDVETEVELMNEGADDYIRKPIDPPRFIARVRATMRRAAL